MEPTRFIDPTTDFGFKRLFHCEPEKDLLIAFLNGIFRGRKEITDIVYNKNEQVGDAEDIGGVIFDLTCTAGDGEKFIIEMQRSAHSNLKRRMLYYGSKLIADQAPKGRRRQWGYDISEVYVVVMMDGFPMPGGTQPGKYLHDICLCDRDTGKVFYPDLGYIYLELVNFTKLESELRDDLDSWLYVLKNMSRLDKIPLYLRKPIFEKLFNIAEYSKLNQEERVMYDVSLKRKWDAEAIRMYQEELRMKEREEREKARLEGLAEGREEGREEVKRQMIESLLATGDFTVTKIASLVKVTEEFVDEVRADLSGKS